MSCFSIAKTTKKIYLYTQRIRLWTHQPSVDQRQSQGIVDMNRRVSRFDCPSASVSLKSLLKRARSTLWIGLGLAVAGHLALTQVGSFSDEDKTTKPLTTQFIKRQPRLTKPLELKKRPRPKRRMMQRRMVSVKAQADRQ